MGYLRRGQQGDEACTAALKGIKLGRPRHTPGRGVKSCNYAETGFSSGTTTHSISRGRVGADELVQVCGTLNERKTRPIGPQSTSSLLLSISACACGTPSKMGITSRGVARVSPGAQRQTNSANDISQVEGFSQKNRRPQRQRLQSYGLIATARDHRHHRTRALGFDPS